MLNTTQDLPTVRDHLQEQLAELKKVRTRIDDAEGPDGNQERLQQLQAKELKLLGVIEALQLEKNMLSGQGAGASSAAVMTRSHLYAKLQHLAATRQIRPIRDKVVNFLIRFELDKLGMADDTLLAELYNSADAAPMTSTKHLLRTSHNITFNGPTAPGFGSTRSVLLVAFVEGSKPKLVKFTFDPDEVKKEYEIHSELVLKGVPHIVKPINKITYIPSSSITVQEEVGQRSMLPRMAIEMPIYPATLAHMQIPVNEEVLLRHGKQLKEALDGVHSLDYVHNDVKAANIFIDSEGDCVLGDFGSACKVGVISKQATLNHWPLEVTETTPSFPAIDHFLLAATLLERAGAYDLGAHPQPSTPLLEAAVGNLKSPQLQDLVSSLIASMRGELCNP